MISASQPSIYTNALGLMGYLYLPRQVPLFYIKKEEKNTEPDDPVRCEERSDLTITSRLSAPNPSSKGSI